MIGMALLLAVQAMPIGGVNVPNAIWVPWTRYMHCLQDKALGPARTMPNDRAVWREQVKTAIAACASVRQTSEAEAQQEILRDPSYPTTEARNAAISKSFDGAEEQERQLPDIMEQITAKSQSNAPNR